jgi:DedD protein
MADRNPDNADLAVDELRRKARRRLVGAVVLALAAAIVVPLLLEKEPKPLGDEVSVQIPPVDEGRFVNRLTGARDQDAASPPKADRKPAAPPDADKGGTKPDAASPPPGGELPATASAPASPTMPIPAAPAGKALADAEQRVLTPAAKPAPKTDTPARAVPAPEAKPAAKGTPTTAPDTASPPSTPPSTPAKAEPTAAGTGASPAPAAPAGFAVQLAAFADDKGANALANRLRKAGYAAYTEAVQTSRGTLWRVRVGGYPTREAAVAARDKLKAEGHSGIVAPAK